MQLMVLGSAAAEGWPAIFCECQACKQARDLGGKNLRRRTSYRLGDRIQIDWGPDTYGAYLDYGLDSSKLRHLIITHTHQDHFTPHELYYRGMGFSQLPPGAFLQIHGPPDVSDALAAVEPDPELLQVQVQPSEPFTDRRIDDDVTMTAVPAAHADDITAYNYIFNTGDRSLLIGHDTGWWDDPTWEALAGCEFNVVIMDCTYGKRDEDTGHLGCPAVVRVKQRLESQDSLADDCQFFANHFFHNGEWLHEKLVEYFEDYDIQPAYDGLTIDI